MAETSVVNFRTPEEFINYYSDAVKRELGVYDLQINKLGFVGFLLNLLGHTNYDAKQYYDSLFKEAFVASSQDTENLYLHASTYGYLPTFANPASASGEVVFDFALLPKMISGVTKREVIFGDDAGISFDIDGHNFITDTRYKFVQTLSGYSSIVTSIEGQVNQLPSASAEIRAPFKNVTQHTSLNFSFTLPNYDFGTYYPYVIEIADGHIADIRVWVKSRNTASDLTEEYKVSYVKYFEESFSKTVFLRKLTSKKFIIEFGSGIRGAFIPSADITVQVTVTRGSKGNISKVTTLSPKGYITLINYYDAAHSNQIQTFPAQSASKFVKMNFQYSENGQDPLSGDALRNDVVNHVQSYDMLVSERDFYNITQKYLSDFKFLFKKSDVSINTFYLCRSFRDKFQTVCPTINHTVKRIDDSLVVTNITESVVDDVNGLIETETFHYIIVPSDGFNYASEEISMTLDTTSRKSLVTEEYTFTKASNEINCANRNGYDAINIGDRVMSEGSTVVNANEVISKDDTDDILILTLSSEWTGEDFTGQIEVYLPTKISLTWDPVTDANKYLVYKVVGSNYYFAETFTNTIDDDGTNFISCGYPLNPGLIFYPKFVVSGETMISPFLYKWNDFMRWYDGYILYDSFSAHFSQITNTGLANYDVPVLYFFIQYDMLNRKTYIDLKSHQDISSYNFKITISERSIYEQELISIDATTWRYEYDDENGIFWEEFHIELTSTKGTDQSFEGSTYAINQIYDVRDQVNVLTYDMFIYSGPGVLDHIDYYIINIPLLGYDKYLDDPEFYLDKTKQFIIDHNIQGKRMVSDNLQFRFLDTLNVPAYYLENFTVQKYNSFDIKFPLKLSIQVIVDSNIVVNKKINLAEKKSEFLLMIADWLQKTHTGTHIAFYNSQVSDLIHTGQDWIKSVKSTLTDSNDVIIDDGLETIPDIDGLENIRDNKLAIIKYSSWFWYWDIDNIELKMVV